MTYEKALRTHICSVVMMEERSSEFKKEETISVKEVLDAAKQRYKRRREFFEDVLSKLNSKVPCIKDVDLSATDEIILYLEEDYTGKRLVNKVDVYGGNTFNTFTEDGKIKLRISIENIDGLKRLNKEREIYFDNGILERIYKGGKSWINKILSEVKEELLKLDEYLIENQSVGTFFVNTISNSFEINLLPDYFGISTMSSEVMSLYKGNKNFIINYPYNQENLERRFKPFPVVRTNEGDFVLFGASRRIRKVLSRKTNYKADNKDLLLEFIKNLRVYKNEVPEFLLK